MGPELLGFSFCVMYLRLGAEKAGELEMPVSTENKLTNQHKLKWAAYGPLMSITDLCKPEVQTKEQNTAEQKA